MKERNKLKSVLDKISGLYDGSIKTSVHGSAGSSAGSAIKLAIDSLKGCTGRILWFCMDIPSLGYGRLASRNNSQLYNTDKEKLIYTQSNTYKDILDECRLGKVGMDVFACGGREMDLATIGALANDTGGELYYYQQFNCLTYSLL
jgi:protein transport protein SEC24